VNDDRDPESFGPGEAPAEEERDEDESDAEEERRIREARIAQARRRDVRATSMPAALPLVGVAALVGLVGLGLLLAARRASAARNAGFFSGWSPAVPVPHVELASLQHRLKRALHMQD
jgi:hypothetical protein